MRSRFTGCGPGFRNLDLIEQANAHGPVSCAFRDPGYAPPPALRYTCRQARRWSSVHKGRRKPMTYDLLIRNGRIVDGSGMPAYPRRCRGEGRQDRRDRQTERAGDARRRCARRRGGARLHRQSLPLRRAGDLGSAVLLFVRSRRHHGDLRQLLAVAGAGAPGQVGAAGRVPVLCRSDPDGGAAHRRFRLGDDAAIHGHSSTAISASTSATSSATPRSATT